MELNYKLKIGIFLEGDNKISILKSTATPSL